MEGLASLLSPPRDFKFYPVPRPCDATSIPAQQGHGDMFQIVIQRRARGVLARNRVRRMHAAAVKAQALIRGGLARRRVAKRRVVMNQLALTIQCAARTYQANRKTQAKRQAKAAEQAREDSAIYIQRVFRGGQGRDEAARKLELYNEQLEQYRAATKLQSMARRDAAIKKVDRIRAQKFDRMNEEERPVLPPPEGGAPPPGQEDFDLLIKLLQGNKEVTLAIKNLWIEDFDWSWWVGMRLQM